MAMVMEVEDDVLFADLNRQISLLITDDEDADDHSNYSSHPTAVSIQQIQAFSRTEAIIYPSTQPQYRFDFDHTSIYTTPTTDHYHQSKGTGVFIPKSSQFTKRIRSSKHQTKSTTATKSYKNNINSYNSSNNFRSSYRQHQQLPSQGVYAQEPQKLISWGLAQ